MLSRRLHGAPDDTGRLTVRQAELETERQALASSIEALRPREPAAQPPIDSPHEPWRPAMNIFLSAGMALLSLEGAGVSLGWHLWAAAALGCTMLAVNLPTVPLVCANLAARARRAHRRNRLQKQLEAVYRQIDRVRERRSAAIDRETAEARWVAEVCAVLRADYELQRSRGRAARRLGRVATA
jgi:hypothetical protein